MNTENIQNPEGPLIRFFSPKTVEERFLLGKFTSDMIREVHEFIPFFTKEDTDKILSCTSPTDCLYIVAGIISHIRLKQSVPHKVEKTTSALRMDEIHERLQEIFPKK